VTKRNERRRREPLPALVDPEQAAVIQHARETLRGVRNVYPDGDPFDSATMHAQVRRTFKALALSNERNAAWVMQLALAGSEDAHQALADIIAMRNVRMEPPGPALSTYINILGNRGGPPLFRQPGVRPRANFLAVCVIVALVIELKREFPWLHLRRRPDSARMSVFAIVAYVLNEAGLLNVTEEGIRKTWEREGPPAAPDAWQSWRGGKPF
jgi:hypothetical protein